MVGRADHLGIVVSDLDRSIEFYQEVLGMTVLDSFKQSDPNFSAAVGLELTRVSLAFLDAGGFTLELIQYRTPEGGDANDVTSVNDIGAAHFCLGVDDIEAAYNRLRDGVDFKSSPRELANGVKLAFFTDPDGNQIELLED